MATEKITAKELDQIPPTILDIILQYIPAAWITYAASDPKMHRGRYYFDPDAKELCFSWWFDLIKTKAIKFLPKHTGDVIRCGTMTDMKFIHTTPGYCGTSYSYRSHKCNTYFRSAIKTAVVADRLDMIQYIFDDRYIPMRDEEWVALITATRSKETELRILQLYIQYH